MEWLKEHMRSHVGNGSATVRSIDQHANFRQVASKPAPGAPPAKPRSERSSALDLVYQAADAIRDIEERAVASETNAQSLAKRAIEQLQMAERRIQVAESGRNAAEAQLQEANIRLEQAEKILERAEARIAAVEALRAHWARLQGESHEGLRRTVRVLDAPER